MRAYSPVPAIAAAAAVALAAAAPASAAIIADHWFSVTVDGVDGVLRAGSPWVPGSTPTSALAPVDGEFEPTGQQWNNGSFWWDEDPSVNQTPVTYTIVLDGFYTLRRFLMQADDNDSYHVEWWDGATWLTAWDVPAVNTFGLETRDSGVLAAITTDRLRLSGSGGDGYYAISEFQAFGVPEPATWALMIGGFALAGAALRRRTGLA